MLDNIKNKHKYLLIGTVLALWVLFLLFNTTIAANVQNRSLTISDPIASAPNVTYTFRFDTQGNYMLGSIVLEICQEDPLPGEPCTAPAGFDSTSRVLSSQTGVTGFTINPLSTNEKILLSRTPQMTAPTSVSYSFTGITNPSANGTYFARIYTYASNDGTGPSSDSGGIAFAINNALGYQAEVPPFLFFCSGVTIDGLSCLNASGQFIDFGEFSSTYTSSATSQFMVATNARSGFNVYTIGQTLTSGNNIISPITTPAASTVGQSQFGINLRDNSNPNVGQEKSGIGAGFVSADYDTVNQYKFANGDVIARSNGTSDFSKFTVSYVVNVNKNQKPGMYSTTFTYLCLANF